MSNLETEYNGSWEGWTTKHVYQVAATIDNDFEKFKRVQGLYTSTRDHVTFKIKLANYLADRNLTQVELNEIYTHYVSKFSEMRKA